MILDTIINIVVRLNGTVEAEDLSDDTRFDEMNLNEFDINEMIIELEDKYDITFTDEQVDTAETIGELSDIIEQQLSVKSDR